MAASLNAFDDLMACQLQPFIQFSGQIGGLVQEQARLTMESFKEQRKFIEMASQMAKPANDVQLMQLLKPISQLITQIQEIKERNRKHEHFNHLSAIAEGIAAIGWVTVVPTPAPYVKEMCDSAQFYTNKVLVAFKDNPVMIHHIDWAKAWIGFLTELQKYIRQHHTTGLVWSSSSSQAAAPLPPPPPPPIGLDLGGKSAADQAMDDARAALFASINKGDDITKGLRKVTADQMTHKNPSLRLSSTVSDNEMKNLPISQQQQSKLATQLRPEKLCLEGRKWMVENFKNRHDLLVDDTYIQQSVNIYQCEDCILTVKGKVNSITLDKCKKFGIVFDSIVSFVELINCRQIKAQAMESVPTITIDFTDGVELYLGQQSLNAEIISSKSSSINVSVLAPNGDYVEHPIPEQLKSTWNGKGFHTEAISKN
ncbi:LOW QUALITY PROTEIN: adenylyl cyclase-associated protein 1 [Dermatophagoides farinae]|uniref:LOW QUALITY PROTEIN: adenylyl cyclase-associated protein 1 n=1 Tax=Dermatophagoides farinae TaxID=6954 RepID=UPI003F5FAEEC